MAHNRLEKIGTIYSRISGLIRSGAMKLEDRPMWYDVYEAFPPKYPPSYDRPAPDIPVRQIFYPEDKIRAKFYKKLKNVVLPPIDLTDPNPTLCQQCIQKCFTLQKEKNIDLEEAFEVVFSEMLAEIKVQPKESLKSVTETEVSEKPVKVDMKDIFNS